MYTYTFQSLSYLSIQYAGAMGDVNRITYIKRNTKTLDVSIYNLPVRNTPLSVHYRI